MTYHQLNYQLKEKLQEIFGSRLLEVSGQRSITLPNIGKSEDFTLNINRFDGIGATQEEAVQDLWDKILINLEANNYKAPSAVFLLRKGESYDGVIEVRNYYMPMSESCSWRATIRYAIGHLFAIDVPFNTEGAVGPEGPSISDFAKIELLTEDEARPVSK